MDNYRATTVLSVKKWRLIANLSIFYVFKVCKETFKFVQENVQFWLSKIMIFSWPLWRKGCEHLFIHAISRLSLLLRNLKTWSTCKWSTWSSCFCFRKVFWGWLPIRKRCDKYVRCVTTMNSSRLSHPLKKSSLQLTSRITPDLYKRSYPID